MRGELRARPRDLSFHVASLGLSASVLSGLQLCELGGGNARSVQARPLGGLCIAWDSSSMLFEFPFKQC